MRDLIISLKQNMNDPRVRSTLEKLGYPVGPVGMGAPMMGPPGGPPSLMGGPAGRPGETTHRVLISVCRMIWIFIPRLRLSTPCVNSSYDEFAYTDY